MKKTLLILSFILLSVVSFAQRQRTTAVFDSDTTTRPKAGFYGIGVRANNIYFVPPTGNNIRLANYSLFTGLTTNYLSKWNGSKLVNSGVFESGGNVGVGTAIPSLKLHIKAGNANQFMIDNSGEQYTEFDFANNGSVKAVNYFDNVGSQFVIRTLGASAIGFETDLIRRLTISSTGNVGIGTASPGAKMDVVSATLLNTRFQRSSGAILNLALDTDAGGTGANLFAINNAGSLYQPIAMDASSFKFRANATEPNGLYITSSGNVGINTTTPTSKLQVVGLPTYADNAAAITGGLTAGAFYRTVLGVLMVVY